MPICANCRDLSRSADAPDVPAHLRPAEEPARAGWKVHKGLKEHITTTYVPYVCTDASCGARWHRGEIAGGGFEWVEAD
jgi:hypothetical protein